MDAWVERAMARWPNVPALYGWLRLDRRGRWLIREGVISNRRIIDVINRNYAADERGCWYFQNGPQRGYVALDYAPLVLRAQVDGGLRTHAEQAVNRVTGAYLDEEGSLTLATEHGPGLVDDHDLEWVLEHLRAPGDDLETGLERALALAEGSGTGLALTGFGAEVPVVRCDGASLPGLLGFVREPAPPDDDTD